MNATPTPVQYACVICGTVCTYTPHPQGRPRLLCGAPTCRLARAQVTGARKHLRLARTPEPCRERTLVCPRADCDMNTAHDGNHGARFRCAYVLAAEGERSMSEVADAMGVTDTFVGQVEARAMRKVREAFPALKEHT